MSEELKPCPFCGSPSVTTQARHPSILPYFVECSTCDARGARREGREAAIAAWNSRPIEDALRDRIDALEWLREVEKTNRGMDEWHPDWKKRGKEANRRRSDARAALRRMRWEASEAVES